MAELIWDGKYKDGKKTSPVKLALPFQTIETVNESVQHNDRTIFDSSNEEKWYNRLIWGDKKYVLPSLLPEFAGKVDLIYIDPPFDTGANFSFTAIIPDNPETDEDESSKFVKQPSLIEQKAYRDTWGKGIDSYMQWFYETALLLRELLSESGSIYVHLDWHVGHYAKVVLDEVFGQEFYRNEIIWYYDDKFATGGNVLDRNHDTIFQYTKTNSFVANKLMIKKDEATKRALRKKVAGKTIDVLDDCGNKIWVEYYEKKVDDVWRIPRTITQRMYATQKPEALLERIIRASSNEGDLVLDCFCGSGTTAAVAEKLNRRWITCDLGRFAIHTARKRMLGISGLKPFTVQNLGKYERQEWMVHEFDDPSSKLDVERRYRKFIMELYQGDCLSGFVWIHGIKSGRFVHIGNVEAPVTVEDIKSSIKEYWQLTQVYDTKASNGLDFLGWDFAFDVNQTAKEYAAANGVDVRFKKIPREVLEKKAVEQGDIKFYELAYLKVEHSISKQGVVKLHLADFIVPTDDIPDDIQCKISHWSQWIDYWAVDWDYQEDTFHNQWQSYRTKQSPMLELSAENEYPESGSYTIVIKVIDLLGNDTTKSISIEV